MALVMSMHRSRSKSDWNQRHPSEFGRFLKFDGKGSCFLRNENLKANQASKFEVLSLKIAKHRRKSLTQLSDWIWIDSLQSKWTTVGLITRVKLGFMTSSIPHENGFDVFKVFFNHNSCYCASRQVPSIPSFQPKKYQTAVIRWTQPTIHDEPFCQWSCHAWQLLWVNLWV